MSANHSAQEWESYSPNLSILDKVKSRVSQWFSPISIDEATGRGREQEPNSRMNGGGFRRRLTETESSPSDEVIHDLDQPPLKRSRMSNNDLTEDDRFRSTSFMAIQSTKMTSSTPTSVFTSKQRSNALANRRKLMGISNPSKRLNDAQKSDLNEFVLVAETKSPAYEPFIKHSQVSRGKEEEIVEDEEDTLEDEDLEEEEENDIVPELNRNNTAGKDDRRRLINGSENLNDSGSESGSLNSSLNAKLSDRRKLSGLSRIGNAARNGSSTSINFSSHLQTEKSLFSGKNIISSSLNNSTTSLNSLAAPKRTFSTSLYGSMSALSDSRLLNTRSPYYNGPTMFGGASAYSQKPILRSNASKLFKSSSGMASIRPSSSLSSLPISSTVSRREEDLKASTGTAKRIMDLLSQFNSPLSDVRRMASGNLLTGVGGGNSGEKKVPSLVSQRSRFTESTDPLSRSIRLNTPRTPYSRNSSKLEGSSPSHISPGMTTELQVPSMSQLLQMTKLQKSTEEIRKMAFSSKSFLNQETEYKLPENAEKNQQHHTSKMKSKISTRPNKMENLAEEQDLVEVPKLPEIKFPEMKSMPKIDFKTTSNEPLKKTTLPVDQLVNEESSKMMTPKSSLKENSPVFRTNGSPNFQFSSPITFNASIGDKHLSPINVNFKFSEPNRNQDGDEVVKGVAAEIKTKPPSVFNSFKFNPDLAKLKSAPTVDSLEDVAKVDSGFMSAASTLKSGSVEDALGLTQKIKPLISNSFGDQFKPASNSWECQMCMVRNKEADQKCLACQSPRITVPVKSLEKAKEKVNDEGFKEIIQQQTLAKWECGMCMLKNDNAADKCACCESARPGVVKKLEEKSLSKAVSNPFAPTTNAKFLFGVPQGGVNTNPNDSQKKTKDVDSKDVGFNKIMSQQNAKWECSTCMTRNEANRSKCACCEQTRPGAESENVPQFSFGPASSKFSFGIVPQQDKAITSSSTALKTVSNPSNPSEPGFLFGVNNPADNPAPKFTFGTTPAQTKPQPKEEVKIVSETVKEIIELDNPKSDSEPKLPFGSSKPVAKVPEYTPGGFKFNIPKTTDPKKEGKPEEETKTPTKAGFTFALGGAAKSPAAVTSFQFGQPKLDAAPENKAETSKSESTVSSSSKIAPAVGFESKLFTSPSAPQFGATSVVPSALGSSTAVAAQENVSKSFFGSGSTATSPAAPIMFGQKPAEQPKVEAAKAFEFPAAKTPFTFGAAATNPATTATTEQKPDPPAFGASSAAAKPSFSFGSNASVTEQAKPAAAASFSFGSPASAPALIVQKPEENKTPVLGASSTFGGFSANAPSSSPFGGAKSSDLSSSNSSPFAAQAPMFGSSANNNVFGGSVTPAVPSFGSSAFGSRQQSAIEPSKSIFGAASASSAPSNPFGSAGGTTNPGFGIGAPPQNKVAMFVSQSQQPSFDVSDGQKAPAFPFGAPILVPETNNNLFSFGGNNNNVSGQQQQQQDSKPGFNFNASVTPSFNFSASPQSSQPFAFSAANPPPQSTFNFTAGSNNLETGINPPAFQFAATTNTNPNPFDPMGGANAQQQQVRKKIKAMRRVNPR